MKTFLRLSLAAALIIAMASCGNPAPYPEGDGDNLISFGTLTIYTSIRESIIDGLIEGFTNKYPDVVVETRIGGAGTLMREIESERTDGAILADLIWTSEVPDFFYMKDEGLLLQYRPVGADNVFNPRTDMDDYFIPARLATLGIAYNTELISEPPEAWNDLLKPDYADSFAIANPALSGTAFISVGLMTETFGEQFFRDLRSNGAFVGQSSTQVVADVASGELAACLAVDYIVFAQVEAGMPIAIAYPHETIIIPSPIAIFKDSPNTELAKLFVDYLISVEAQRIVANGGTLPVLTHLPAPAKYNIPAVGDALVRSMKMDDAELHARKDEIVENFLSIMEG
jgi:iron(III) transport system substrate-binding protein